MEEHIMSNTANVLKKKKKNLFSFQRKLHQDRGLHVGLERPWADRGNKNPRTGDVLEG